MPNVLLDCYSGIAGDMLLGALLDVGAPFGPLLELPQKLGLGGVTIRHEIVSRRWMRGVKVHIDVAEEKQPHRTWKLIDGMIAGADLQNRAQQRARAVFRVLGEAEAYTHNCDINEVHFHEVGAVDSILDIVGCCVLLEALDIEQVFVGPVAIGKGIVKGAHGVMPLPAPATQRLLEGRQVQPTELPFELTTPTGAALLKGLATSEPAPRGLLGRSGFGAGTRELPDRANMVRATLLLDTHAGGAAREELVLVEATIDDCSPEIVGDACERLEVAGALETLVFSAAGKKRRAAMVVRALCRPEIASRLEEVLFRETTTLGVRSWPLQRRALERRVETVETPWGAVRVKVGLLDGKVVTVSPEFDDCRELAEREGIAAKLLYEEARQAFKAT